MSRLISKDFLGFFFKFFGILAIGLFVLVAVGFYQVEIAGVKNLSSPSEANQNLSGSLSQIKK